MITKRDTIVFLAGAEAFHTLSHIVLAYPGFLPIRVKGITVTKRLNAAAIFANVAATAGLLYWASRLATHSIPDAEITSEKKKSTIGQTS